MDRSLKSNSQVCWLNLYQHLRKASNRMVDAGGKAGTLEFKRTYVEMIEVRNIVMRKYSQDLQVL